MNSMLFAGQGNHFRIAPPQKKCQKKLETMLHDGFPRSSVTNLDNDCLPQHWYHPTSHQPTGLSTGATHGDIPGSPASQTLECRRPRSLSMVQWPSARDRPTALQWKLEERSVSAPWLGNRLWFFEGENHRSKW